MALQTTKTNKKKPIAPDPAMAQSAVKNIVNPQSMTPQPMAPKTMPQIGAQMPAQQAPQMQGVSAPLPNTNIKFNKDQYGNVATVDYNGKNISADQFKQLVNAQMKGFSPQDPTLAGLYAQNKTSAESQRLNSPENLMKIQNQLMESQKTQQIQNQLMPPQLAPGPNQYAGPQINAELPQMQPTNMGGDMWGEMLQQGTQGALTAGAAAGIGTLLTPAAPAAPAVAGVAAAGGFVVGTIRGGFSADKSRKAKTLTESGSLASEAERGIKATIVAANKGLAAGDAKERFEQDVAYLSQARSNLKALDAKDHSYFLKNGLDEQAAVERAIVNIAFYKTQLETTLANPNPNRADAYTLNDETGVSIPNEGE